MQGFLGMTRAGGSTPVLVLAEGAVLRCILETERRVAPEGLSRRAFQTMHEAQSKTLWGTRHERWYALVDGNEVLASAMACDLIATLGGRSIRVLGIGSVCSHSARAADSHTRALVAQLVDVAERTGADLALLWSTPGSEPLVSEGFESIPMLDVELTVSHSVRHGAPMTLVRSGEDRDLAAIVAMGAVRAGPFRFHPDRDVDYVKYVITKKRLLAGVAPRGTREVQFVIAEEGITAAAYVVLSIAGGTWILEECGDRDPSGARVGALLQALIAREPAEQRPVIRGWLPSGFLPPQATILSSRPSPETLLVRPLT